MEMQVMKKARVEDEDRISKLSDDVIHQIMSFLDIRSAVQTSVLSKRWKHVWRTLPFLNINECLREDKDGKKLPRSKFLNNVFSRRIRQSGILKLELYPNARELLDLRLIKKYVKYAISHNVEHLNVQSNNYCSLSMFNSDSLKVLKVLMKFESETVMESHCWSLPKLTTLFLARNHEFVNTTRKFPQSCLTCLPALTTLVLSHCRLPEIFSFPGLTTLCLQWCTMPQKVWVLPALLNLELSDVAFPVNMSEYFRALVSLQDLAIDFGGKNIGSCVISNSQLVNLKTRAPLNSVNASEAKIVVLAPKLCNFTAVGFFPTTFEGSMLENVNIKFWDWTMYKYKKKHTPSWVLKQHLDLFRIMLSQLRSAKILSLDLVTLQALSEISDILVDMHSPFNNLKFFKLPPGCEESSISSSVRKYLLCGSPSATIVKTLSRDDVNSQYTHMNNENVDLRVPKERMVENSVVVAEKVRQIGAPVTGSRNDWGSSSGKNSHTVLWQGHEVNSEFVGLLDLIMKRVELDDQKFTFIVNIMRRNCKFMHSKFIKLV
ncbi:hypothetical protein POM88_025117 [Heracleum sosnowskyi]|uniref:F-box domain-containing protein n=1 Tax=Heracleum sosnowskyi TaxID=360622 RepID=A0AAD8I5T2_9APIA|nr:hypothetical protein POM88_025117 [Heracleum sosnowskyi]